MKRTSWDVKGKKTKNYSFPSEIESAYIDLTSTAPKRPLNSPIGHANVPLASDRWLMISVPRKLEYAPSVRFTFGNRPVQQSEVFSVGRPRWWVAPVCFSTSDFAGWMPTSVGIADGEWTTSGTWIVGSARKTGLNFKPRFKEPNGPNGLAKPNDQESSLEVTIPDRIKDLDWRVAAFDRTGKDLPSAGFIRIPGESSMELFSAPQSEIARVELQTRSFVWTAVGNVPLNPK